MWAARHGHLSMVETLLANGLNLLQAPLGISIDAMGMGMGHQALGESPAMKTSYFGMGSVWVPGFGPMTIWVLMKMGMHMVIDGD